MGYTWQEICAVCFFVEWKLNQRAIVWELCTKNKRRVVEAREVGDCPVFDLYSTSQATLCWSIHLRVVTLPKLKLRLVHNGIISLRSPTSLMRLVRIRRPVELWSMTFHLIETASITMSRSEILSLGAPSVPALPWLSFVGPESPLWWLGRATYWEIAIVSLSQTYVSASPARSPRKLSFWEEPYLTCHL